MRIILLLVVWAGMASAGGGQAGDPSAGDRAGTTVSRKVTVDFTYGSTDSTDVLLVDPMGRRCGTAVSCQDGDWGWDSANGPDDLAYTPEDSIEAAARHARLRWSRGDMDARFTLYDAADGVYRVEVTAYRDTEIFLQVTGGLGNGRCLEYAEASDSLKVGTWVRPLLIQAVNQDSCVVRFLKARWEKS